MVQTMLPENKNNRQCPEQEAERKRRKKGKHIQQDPPLHKPTNEWGLESLVHVNDQQCNPLTEPPLLNLKLKKSPSAMELFAAELAARLLAESKKKEPHVTSKKDVKASGPVENLKASNFPALLLRIGDWEYVSRHEGDLVAKCYFAKHKIVWEVLDGGLKNKIEFEWRDISALKANCPDNGPGTLTIVVNKQPQFFRETNPQPRKHTVWQATTDFTGGEASKYRTHYLQCAPGVLDKHYEKLINCDTRLHSISQMAPDVPLVAKDPNVLNNLDWFPRDIIQEHGFEEGWRLVREKAIQLINASWAQQAGNVNNTGHCVSEQTRAYQNQLLENISRILMNDKPWIIPSDERSPVSGINSLSDTGAGNGNYHGGEWPDGNDSFNPCCNPTPENDKGMSRDDSFTDLLHQLPQIESLPVLFFDTSQHGDFMGF